MTEGQQPGKAPGAGAGWAVLGTLIAGMAVWGGVGWLLDRWMSTRAFTAIGVIVGVATAIYVIAVKYGK
jgi:F0F1-type ATP synthase assembly protein I